MSRIRKICITMLMTVVMLCLGGCGEKAEEISTAPNLDIITYTRGQWIQDLSDTFGYGIYVSDDIGFSDLNGSEDYYDAVISCAEWEVIPSGGEFKPNEKPTWQFALNTTVKAIGLDSLAQAGYEVDENSLAEFFMQNIAAVDVDLSEPIDEKEAVQVLEYAADFESKLEFQQIENVVYKENVSQATQDEVRLKGDGKTAIIVGTTTYSVGDILFVSDGENGEETAIRVDAIDGNQISYSVATIDEVFDTIEIHGTYTPEIKNVITGCADHTVYEVANSLYGGNDPYMLNPLHTPEYQAYCMPTATDVDVSVGKNGASFKVYDTDGLWSAEAGVKNIKVNADIDYKWVKLKKASIDVSYDSYVHLEANGQAAKTVSLGTIPLEITPGITVDISLFLNVGVDGTATIDYSTSFSAGATYKDGKFKNNVNTGDTNFDYHAEVTMTAEPLVKVDLKILKQSVINVKVTTGVVAIATVDVDLLGEEPACVDVKAHVPLRWAINEDGCLVTAILGNKAKVSKTVWNSENSKFQWHWHWENLELVEECTRGKGEEVETETVDENGEPLDEYKIFEFEEINFGVIRLECYTMYLEKGESLNIGIKELPANVESQNLLYEVMDGSNVCSVNAGVVTANVPGATNIRISTEDGQYNAYLTVVVAEEYNDTSDFVPLQ